MSNDFLDRRKNLVPTRSAATLCFLILAFICACRSLSQAQVNAVWPSSDSSVAVAHSHHFNSGAFLFDVGVKTISVDVGGKYAPSPILQGMIQTGFWQAWWFPWALFVIPGLLGWSAHRRSIRKLREELNLRKLEAKKLLHGIEESVRQLQDAEDAADAAARAKGEFLGGMSHDIRTPMNGILGMTEMALNTDLTIEQREYLEMIRVSADTLLNVINEILDFSRMEAGKLDIDPIPFKLRDSVSETMKPLAMRASEKHLELTCDVRPEVPDDVIADPTRIRQVMTSLISSALKFTEKGEVNLEVRLGPLEKNRAQLHFVIRNLGLPGEKQELVFDAFSQIDDATARRFGGTGLGLTISARLVEMMGGRIWFENHSGSDCGFHFTTTVTIDRSAQPIEPIPQVQLVGLPMLVVVENATSRRILGEMLEQIGMKPVLPTSADGAMVEIAKMQERGHAFPLILIDIHMEEMDGFFFVEEIKRTFQLSKTVLIVLASAGQRGDAVKCRQLGASAYLTKPVSQRQLLDAILGCMSVHAESAQKPYLITRHTLGEGPRKMRILLVEDNPVNQKFVLRLLEKQGHTVFLASNGREALAALEGQSFDLVLMDIQMPEMDGVEATPASREKEKGTRTHLPIVALTAHAMKGDRERCLEAGMDGYVSKPIRAQQLFDEIELCTRVSKIL